MTLCIHCHGTGSATPGYLDCGYCDVAIERKALEAAILSMGRLSDEEMMWEAYKIGKDSALLEINQQEGK